MFHTPSIHGTAMYSYHMVAHVTKGLETLTRPLRAFSYMPLQCGSHTLCAGAGLALRRFPAWASATAKNVLLEEFPCTVGGMCAPIFWRLTGVVTVYKFFPHIHTSTTVLLI